MQVLDQMTNEEIVLQLKKSFDEKRFEFLVRRFNNLFFKLYKKYYIYSFEREDYNQEFRIILYRSIQTYETNTQNYFAPFLKRMLVNHFINLARINKAQKRFGCTQVIFLYSGNRFGEGGFPLIDTIYDEFAPSAQDVVEVRENCQAYFCALSEVEKQVFKLYLEGHTLREVSEKAELSLTQTRSALTRCKDKMRKMYHN